MAINVDDAYELYERIAENQSMWSSNKEVLRKITVIYNVDAVIALTAQMETITRKLDSLTQTVNMVSQQKSVMRKLSEIAAALANRAQGTLSSDTEKNPKEHVLAVEAMNYATIETPSIKPATPIRAYMLPIPFPQRLQRQPKNEQNNKLDKQFKKFLNTLGQLHFNIPFIDAILQISNYAKFLKEMLTKKRKLPEHETIALSEECIAISSTRSLPNLKIQGVSLYLKLGLGDPNAASIILQLADRSLKHPYEIVEDILIKAGEFIFPVDFIILDVEEAF
ncbi:uncharacterized protein LOC111367018 [Olea europaea var. sylvestris]|uniref:uncharacterized protein LOC111367018 n=1 Tax=Olea europaea var. sylvestris TaxID=158386 RepID=UPI000C1CF88E|nr:uncharacterized protein LOC111367018 [Olea europaea var. sylvestris]